MLQFLENVTFSAIDLPAISVERPEVCIAALTSVFDSIQAGNLRPSQPVSVYGVGEMEEAFGKMQTGQHVGKVVLEMRGHDQVKVNVASPLSYLLVLICPYFLDGTENQTQFLTGPQCHVRGFWGIRGPRKKYRMLAGRPRSSPFAPSVKVRGTK